MRCDDIAVVVALESHYHSCRTLRPDWYRTLESDQVDSPPQTHCSDDPLCPLPLDAVGYISKLWRKNDLNVYFMRPHELQDTIMAWASEWSNYCAIVFHKTSDLQSSDIRVDFNEGEVCVRETMCVCVCVTFMVQCMCVSSL